MSTFTHTPDVPSPVEPHSLRLTRILLVVSIGLGILGAYSLQSKEWGAGFTLFILACCAAVGLVWRLAPARMTGGGRWLIGAIIPFAIAYVVRDAEPLRALNLLGLALLIVLAAYRARAGRIRVAGIADFAAAATAAALGAGLGALYPISPGASWAGLRLNRAPTLVLRVAAGGLIALPLLVIFGALFGSADPDFRELLASLFRWDLSSLIRNLVWFAVIGWMSLGLLKETFGRVWLSGDGERRPNLDLKPFFQVGTVEAAVALTLINLMFAVFVAFQLRYLFSLVPIGQTPGLNPYADYARRGFFELVTVAALTLPTLLTADWITRRESPARSRVFRVLSLVLIGLLFVIMASALQRMGLYTEAYGLTELRVYTTAFMLWLTAVFVWFGLTVLRGARPRFAFGALVAGLAAILILNAMSPDALIVQTNAARSLLKVQQASPKPGQSAARIPAEASDAFDTSYAARLSADAYPALLAAMPGLPRTDACALRSVMRASAAIWDATDWRALHFSQWQATRALADNTAWLDTMCG